MSVVAISGSLSNPSRTSVLAQLAAEQIAQALHTDALLLRVADHGAALGGALGIAAIARCRYRVVRSGIRCAGISDSNAGL